MATRIGIASLVSSKIGSIELPEEINMYCPQCGEPVMDKGQCSAELRTVSTELFDMLEIVLLVDCRKCGCSDKAPVQEFHKSII